MGPPRIKFLHRLRIAILCALFSCGFFYGAPAARAQTPLPRPPPEEPAPDPYDAEKSVEIGKFYMKKGKYDAAIERFQLAIKYQPKLALPRRLIAEVYEKKKDKLSAVEWYQKYLDVLPQAEDADKVRKRIDVLKQEMEKKPAPRASS
jgi:tetratricopeptide (TPR) repeat protein